MVPVGTRSTCPPPVPGGGGTRRYMTEPHRLPWARCQLWRAGGSAPVSHPSSCSPACSLPHAALCPSPEPIAAGREEGPAGSLVRSLPSLPPSYDCLLPPASLSPRHPFASGWLPTFTALPAKWVTARAGFRLFSALFFMHYDNKYSLPHPHLHQGSPVPKPRCGDDPHIPQEATAGPGGGSNRGALRVSNTDPARIARMQSFTLLL